jgi:AraC-like DNA-binding protein
MKHGFPRPKVTRSPHGYEIFCYPSIFARQVWLYVLCIGESNCSPGFEHGHPDRDCRHKDDEGFLLHFLLQGELWHRAGEGIHTAVKNEAALLDLSRPVRYGNNGTAPARFYWVWFSGKEMRKIAGELNARECPIFHGLDRRRTTATFRELLQLVQREPRGHEARVSALLSGLLAELFAVTPSPTSALDLRSRPFAASEPIQTALKYIARFHGRPLSLKEVSQEIGLSVYHFSHLFHRETGTSPMQYLQRYRIEQAKTLLSESEMPVEAVARAVGIPNHEHFSKLFRQANGASPRAYRARMQEKLGFSRNTRPASPVRSPR